jgi:hypothetical protein
MKRSVLLLILAVLQAAACRGQAVRVPHILEVEELDGGTVVTKLSNRIQVNEGSSLHRKWFVLNDSTCPMRLLGAGITTVYKAGSDYSIGEYQYQAEGSVRPSVPVQAYEIRFVLLDVFGSHMRTLSLSRISDVRESDLLGPQGHWRAWENDVSELLTVVAYVANVRLTDGSVWTFDPRAVLAQLEKIKAKVTEQQLAPESTKKGEK